MRPLGTDRRRPSLTFHRTRAELRALVLGARVVITDLPHVTTWARASGKALLAVRVSGADWIIRTPAAHEIIAELDDVLSHAMRHAMASMDEWDRGPPPAHMRADRRAIADGPSFEVDQPTPLQ
jgi:hypothetical protein